MKYLKNFKQLNEQIQDWLFTAYKDMNDNIIIEINKYTGGYVELQGIYNQDDNSVKISPVYATTDTGVESTDKSNAKYNLERKKNFEKINQDEIDKLEALALKKVQSLKNRLDKVTQRRNAKDAAATANLSDELKSIQPGDKLTIYYSGTGYEGENEKPYEGTANSKPYVSDGEVWINTDYQSGDDKAVLKHGKWRNGASWFEKLINKR